jgi:hypothetical protein
MKGSSQENGPLLPAKTSRSSYIYLYLETLQDLRKVFMMCPIYLLIICYPLIITRYLRFLKNLNIEYQKFNIDNSPKMLTANFFKAIVIKLYGYFTATCVPTLKNL